MYENCFVVKSAEYFKALSVKHPTREVNGRSFCSLTYRYSGKVLINAKGAELISEKDSVTFVPKSLPYFTEVAQDTCFIGIHFDVESKNLPTVPFVIHGVGSTIRTMFESLIKPRDGLAAELSKAATLYGLFAELLMRTDGLAETVPEKIKRAKETLDKEYGDPCFSIGELCRRLGVTTAYVRREFALGYGQSPISYLKEIKIRNAKELLLSSKMPVSVVAKLCGYSSFSYFIQDFRRATGEAPGEYRKRICFEP